MAAEAGGKPVTVEDWLQRTLARLLAANLHFGHGSLEAHDEAVYLLLHTLGLPLDELDPVLGRRLTEIELGKLEALVRRRIDKRLPAAYLTNEAWLGDCRFYVDERVIVPRSYIAELLRDELYPWIPEDRKIARTLDLCTGSGCLAILAALTFPESRVDATELSMDALEVARRNVADYRLQDRVRLVQGDLYAGLDGKYDLILSNPPYVDRASMEALPAEYRAEPEMALAGGEDGLDLVRKILADAPARLRSDGWLVVEIGHNREALERAYPSTPFTWLETSGGDGFVFLLAASDLPR